MKKGLLDSKNKTLEFIEIIFLTNDKRWRSGRDLRSIIVKCSPGKSISCSLMLTRAGFIAFYFWFLFEVMYFIFFDLEEEVASKAPDSKSGFNILVVK